MNEDDLYYAWLGGLYHVGRREKLYLLSLFRSPKALYEASGREIASLYRLGRPLAARAAPDEFMHKSLRRAERNLALCERYGASVLTIVDEAYPARLRAIPDAPIALYARGDLSMLQGPCVAVVGTRRCSPYGRWAAAGIAKRAAAAGAAILSGMAAGIDAAAHEAALACGGATAAVFGTGLDCCFPASNEALYRVLFEKGLILSEYDFGEKGNRFHFPERNRIISGLCEKMVIVEGGVRSGSMISAGLALEQGREVFAVPGNINQPGSAGVNRLIADGAYPILDLESVAELFGLRDPQKEERVREALSGSEQKIYELLLRAPGSGAERLSLESALPPRTVGALLAGLELKGWVRCEGGLFFVKRP